MDLAVYYFVFDKIISYILTIVIIILKAKFCLSLQSQKTININHLAKETKVRIETKSKKYLNPVLPLVKLHLIRSNKLSIVSSNSTFVLISNNNMFKLRAYFFIHLLLASLKQFVLTS